MTKNLESDIRKGAVNIYSIITFIIYSPHSKCFPFLWASTLIKERPAWPLRSSHLCEVPSFFFFLVVDLPKPNPLSTCERRWFWREKFRQWVLENNTTLCCCDWISIILLTFCSTEKRRLMGSPELNSISITKLLAKSTDNLRNFWSDYIIIIV